MTKPELIAALSAKADVNKNQAQGVLDVLSEIIKEEVYEKGGQLSIPGLGTFKKKEVEARTGRNPRTGDVLNIPAKTKLIFSATASLRK